MSKRLKPEQVAPLSARNKRHCSSSVSTPPLPLGKRLVACSECTLYISTTDKGFPCIDGTQGHNPLGSSNHDSYFLIIVTVGQTRYDRPLKVGFVCVHAIILVARARFGRLKRRWRSVLEEVLVGSSMVASGCPLAPSRGGGVVKRLGLCI